MFFYELMRWFGVISGYPAYLVFFKKKVYYEDKRSSNRHVKGGALIITNHFNPLDYVSNVLLFFPRKLYVVASEHAFKNKALRFGMKFWGGIEANRETGSMRFVIESIREIKKGHIVQIFPEGHNTPDGTIKEFYPSYISIALRANAPIVPVVTDGNYGLFKRTHVMIGKKIYLSDYIKTEKYTKEDVTRLNTVVREKMLDLRDQLERRKCR